MEKKLKPKTAQGSCINGRKSKILKSLAGDTTALVKSQPLDKTESHDREFPTGKAVY